MPLTRQGARARAVWLWELTVFGPSSAPRFPGESFRAHLSVSWPGGRGWGGQVTWRHVLWLDSLCPVWRGVQQDDRVGGEKRPGLGCPVVAKKSLRRDSSLQHAALARTLRIAEATALPRMPLDCVAAHGEQPFSSKCVSHTLRFQVVCGPVGLARITVGMEQKSRLVAGSVAI